MRVLLNWRFSFANRIQRIELPALVTLVLFALLAQDALGQLEPADIVAGYRQNLLNVRTLHMRWEVVTENHPGYYQLQKRSFELSGKKPSGEQTAEDKEQVERARQWLAAPATERAMYDLWATREAFQLRTPVLRSLNAQPAPIPDFLAATANLERDFPQVSVWSQLPGGDYRVWGGLDPKQRAGGSIGTGPAVNVLGGGFGFPLLGDVPPAWGGTKTMHELERLILDPTTQFRLAETDTLEGKSCYVLETVISQKALPAERWEGHQVEVKRSARIWFCPELKFLPLQTAWTIELVIDGVPRSTRVRVDPSQVVRLSNIEWDEGRTIAYPRKIALTIYTAIPDGPVDTTRAVHNIVTGKEVSYRPAVPINSVTWHIHTFEPNIALTNDQLAFDFPDGTEYFDTTRKKGMIQGLSEEHLDRMLQAHGVESPARQSWLTWRQRLINLALGALAIGVCFLIYRYLSSRTVQRIPHPR